MRLLIRKLGKIRDMLYPHHVIIRRGRVEWSVNNFRAEYFFFFEWYFNNRRPRTRTSLFRTMLINLTLRNLWGFREIRNKLRKRRNYIPPLLSINVGTEMGTEFSSLPQDTFDYMRE